MGICSGGGVGVDGVLLKALLGPNGRLSVALVKRPLGDARTDRSRKKDMINKEVRGLWTCWLREWRGQEFCRDGGEIPLLASLSSTMGDGKSLLVGKEMYARAAVKYLLHCSAMK